MNVDPEWIKEQRTLGWPDMHPEDYCHRCGERNPLWFTDAETWRTATEAWAQETGREGICCPRCLTELHESATGERRIWRFVPWDREPVDLTPRRHTVDGCAGCEPRGMRPSRDPSTRCGSGGHNHCSCSGCF